MQGERTEQDQHNIKWLDIIYDKSECYYQKGYDLATRRQLSQALPYLQKAVALNKYHLNAYNLIGLIYFELGETGHALKTWILSTSVQKERNRASSYLEQVKGQKRTLEKYKQAMKLYNEAINYFEHNNEDMAVIRLKKCVQIHPQFVEARNLLTLVYIKQHKKNKAMDQIREVLTIDTYNSKALAYLKEIQLGEELGRSVEEPEKTAYVPKKEYMRVQKVINRGHVLGTAIVYFIFGVLCMFAVQVGLILPSKTESLEQQVQQVRSQSESDLEKLRGSLAEAGVEIVKLKEENKKLTAQKEELQMTNSHLAQQTRVNTVSSLKETKNWVEASEILYTIAPDQLDAQHRKQYNALVEEIYPKAAETIYAEGLGRYQKGEYIEAFAQFEKVQRYGIQTPTVANSLYYMGMIEEKNNQPDKAVEYYQTICAQYQGISAYYKAKDRIKKIAK